MKKKVRLQPRFFLFILIVFAIVGGCIVALIKFSDKKDEGNEQLLQTTPVPAAADTVAVTPPPDLPDGLQVHASSAADPTLFGFSTVFEINRKESNSYTREPPISFKNWKKYTDIPGVLTFGGNNYRNSFSYGTVTMEDQMLVKSWEQTIGGIGTWMGTGWTGQPLIIQWPENIRKILGVSQEYRDKENFTEVIYPAMDGKIYFFDLETGNKTRTPIEIGVVIKSTPCLDPNGYPVLYVGQSIQNQNDKGKSVAYVHAYSLITNEEICRFGGHDYFSEREWQAYDSSPLIVDDTLIYAGENGILYSCKLNTDFNEKEATVTVNPERLVKYRYSGSEYSKSDAEGSRWYGIESSVSGFQDYMYFADNGGRLQCVNVNSLKLEFVADLNEDADATVAIDESYPNNTIYLYTASQVKNATTDGEYGYSYHRCFDGLTGDLKWEEKWLASVGDDNSSGGTIATPQVGRGNCSDLVYYSMNLSALTSISAAETEETAETGEQGGLVLGGRIVAYNKNNGEIVWNNESTSDYWSSPVLVYKENGKGYLIQCDRDGYIKMYDALTGTELSSVNLGSRIDSTPAVFNNYIIVGTRGKGGTGDSAKIACVKIS